MDIIDYYLTNTFPVDDFTFKNLIATGNEKTYANLMYAYHLLKNGDTKKARLIINNIDNESKNDTRDMVKGLLELSIGERDKALVLFEKAYSYNPKNKWLNLELFYFHLEQDDISAWKHLENALKIDSGFSEALIAKALYLDPVENCEEIIRDLSKIPESYKDYQVSYLLGLANINLGNTPKSLQLLEKSISIKETSNTYLSLAVLHNDYIDDNAKAKYFFKKSIEIDSNNIFAITAYAWFLHDSSDYINSETFFLKLLDIDRSQEVYNQVIQFYLSMQNFKNADQKIKESREKKVLTL